MLRGVVVARPFGFSHEDKCGKEVNVQERQEKEFYSFKIPFLCILANI